MGAATVGSAPRSDVDKPLLSVAQIVAAGCKVIFGIRGSYIEQPNSGEYIELEQTGGLYTLKMWCRGNNCLPGRTRTVCKAKAKPPHVR